LHWNVNVKVDIAAGIECRRVIQCMCGSDARLIWWAGRAGSGALVLHRREHSIIGRRHGPAGSDATVTVEKALNYTWDERKTTRQLQDRIAGFRKRDDE
jgi:hypothetical protein